MSRSRVKATWVAVAFAKQSNVTDSYQTRHTFPPESSATSLCARVAGVVICRLVGEERSISCFRNEAGAVDERTGLGSRRQCDMHDFASIIERCEVVVLDCLIDAVPEPLPELREGYLSHK